MPKSMTGYGRNDVSTKAGKLQIEVQSINRRFLEVYTYLPKEIQNFDGSIRKEVSNKISRGLVSVRINFILDEKNVNVFSPDINVLKKMKSDYEKIASELNYSKDKIDFEFLLEQYKTFNTNSLKEIIKEKEFFLCLNGALDKLNEMRESEGKSLLSDIKKRLTNIKKILSEIKKISPSALEHYKNKLQEKCKTLSVDIEVKEDRMMQEIVLFSEKVDITEELIRLDSHIQQFLDLLKEQQSVGRKMDFLSQEMQREINTIASKACDSTISKHVIDIKSEIEKIREQAQNIE